MWPVYARSRFWKREGEAHTGDQHAQKIAKARPNTFTELPYSPDAVGSVET